LGRRYAAFLSSQVPLMWAYSGGKDICGCSCKGNVDLTRGFRVGVVAEALRTSNTRAVVSGNGVKDKIEILLYLHSRLSTLASTHSGRSRNYIVGSIRRKRILEHLGLCTTTGPAPLKQVKKSSALHRPTKCLQFEKSKSMVKF